MISLIVVIFLLLREINLKFIVGGVKVFYLVIKYMWY